MNNPFVPRPLLVVLLLATVLPNPLRADSDPVAGDLAITSVTVIDVESGLRRPDQTVIVEGERIVAVGPAKTTRAKDGTKLLDGTGKFLVPGLWDMHAHVADPKMADLFLRHGVTGIRHMFSLFSAVDARASDPASKGSGPRVVAGTHLLDGTKTGFPRLLAANVVIADTAEEAKKGVATITAAKNEFLKVHLALPKDAYLAAADRAKALRLPVVGHVPFAVSAAEASDAGQLTIEHLDGVAAACAKNARRFLAQRRDCLDAKDPGASQAKVAVEAMQDQNADEAKKLFGKFVTNGTWHLPNLVQTRAASRLGDRNALAPEVEKQLPPLAKIFWDRSFPKEGGVLLKSFQKTFTPAELATRKEQYEGEMKLTGQMHKAGVRLLAGSDTPYPLVVPGLSLLEELELLVGAGLTPVEALRTATINPAICLGREKELGSVTVGKYADLVLLSADPTKDITNVRKIDAVIFGGRVVAR